MENIASTLVDDIVNYSYIRVLSFKDVETAELFRDTFIDLIEQAKNFI